MNVIGGNLKGMQICKIKNDVVKPTVGRVKEALFDIIQFKIQNSVFLDLFAGTGQIGIEAISRGAEKVILVDSNKTSIQNIRKNVAKIKFRHDAQIIFSDAIKFLQNYKKIIDIAFLDPPFNSDLALKSLIILEKVIKENGIILAETLVGQKIPENFGNFVLIKKYNYGKIILNYFGINV